MTSKITRVAALLPRLRAGESEAYATLLEAFRVPDEAVTRERISAVLADIASLNDPPLKPSDVVIVLMIVGLLLPPARIVEVLDVDLAAIRAASRAYADARIHRK